jgi:hypothetical protein
MPSVRICEFCGVSLEGKRSHAWFCGGACRGERYRIMRRRRDQPRSAPLDHAALARMGRRSDAGDHALFRAPPKIPIAQKANSTSMSASSVRLATSLTARIYVDRCHVKPLRVTAAESTDHGSPSVKPDCQVEGPAGEATSTSPRGDLSNAMRGKWTRPTLRLFVAAVGLWRRARDGRHNMRAAATASAGSQRPTSSIANPSSTFSRDIARRYLAGAHVAEGLPRPLARNDLHN